jgi:hypothetical protein
MNLSVRRARQRGSALLIVFVFAAVLAIMLYREMPVVAFEAQRQKEELLIDRGNEYEHAIKLYVRKFQSFPASMEALENTNRVRFLRNRYVDPYSGKDDWRLLHAGPGGIIIDSKIKPKNTGLNGAANATNGSNSSSTTATSASSSSTSSNTNSSSVSNGSTDPNALLNGQPATANPFPSRPPAVSMDGGNIGASTQDPLAASAAGQSDPSANLGQQLMAPDGSPVSPARPSRFRNGNVPGDPNAAAQAQSGAAATGNSQDPQAIMQTLMNANNPQAAAQSGSSATGATGNGITPAAGTGTFSGAMNQGTNTMGGGIAGVASKTAGHTIKIVNDQTDRSLWEFVYDMQKELMANAPGMANGAAQNNGANANGAQNGNGMGMNNSSFNSPSQTNTFGSGFGSSGSQMPATPQQPAPTANQ